MFWKGLRSLMYSFGKCAGGGNGKWRLQPATPREAAALPVAQAPIYRHTDQAMISRITLPWSISSRLRPGISSLRESSPN